MKSISRMTVKYFIFIIFISSGVSLFSAQENVYEGKVIEMTEEEQTGWDSSDLKTSAYLKFPDTNSKWITWVIQPGVFVKEGVKLVKSDATYKNLEVKIAEFEKKIKTIILDQAKKDMERYRQLAATATVSVKDKERVEAVYYEALEEYKLAEQGLIHAETDVMFCDIPAPYDCYVDKVYLKPKSVCDIDYPILKLIRLSPLFVEVKLDRSTAKKIYDQKLGVSIYPLNSDKAVGIFNEKIVMVDDGIRLPVKNYIIDDYENEGMPLVTEVGYVSAFDIGSKLSITTKEKGILENLLYKDDKGTYVWKAVGQKALIPGKVINSEFDVKKVYIEKTGLQKEGFDGKMCQIKDTDKLQINDILIKHAPKDIKDGEKVLYKKKRCLFWPGDNVKVVLNEI